MCPFGTHHLGVRLTSRPRWIREGVHFCSDVRPTGFSLPKHKEATFIGSTLLGELVGAVPTWELTATINPEGSEETFRSLAGWSPYTWSEGKFKEGELEWLGVSIKIDQTEILKKKIKK